MFVKMLTLLTSATALSLGAAQYADSAVMTPEQSAPAQTTAAQEEAVNLKASAAEADRWLKLIDEGKYGESWDTASNIFRFTIKRDEWIKAQDKLHAPFGKLVSRQLVEQRPAKDPKGLPAGDYMVIYYKSAFANHPQASELLTMVLSTDGNWKVLTYHASF